MFEQVYTAPYTHKEIHSNKTKSYRVHTITFDSSKVLAYHSRIKQGIGLIRNKLNPRQRKLLSYKTPNKVYEAMSFIA